VLFNIYSSYNLTDSLHVDGTLGYGYTDYTFSRNVVFHDTNRVNGLPVVTEGRTHGNEISANAGIGYDFYEQGFGFGPYFRVGYTRSTVRGYTEDDISNTGLNMAIQDDTVTSLTTTAGVQMSYAHSTEWGVVIPQVRFEYEHEFDKNRRSLVSSFAQTNTANFLAVTTDDPDRNYFNLGASLLFVLPNGWMPFVDVETLLGYSDLDRQRYTAGLRVEF
jgi:outer membrane lipase/esterase